MSRLSREIAKWLQTNPGPVSATEPNELWLKAKMKFMAERRWREEFDIAVFMQHLRSLGYVMEHRTVHAKDQPDLVVLPLPAAHKGF